MGNWVGNSALTCIEDLVSVLVTENHTVDRVMGDPDQWVKQDLGEPGGGELEIDDVADVRKLFVGHLDLETACEFYKG